MYDINKYEFYRSLCKRYPYYCDACEHEEFDLKNQIWGCPYDRLGDAISQISLLETDDVHLKKED